LQAGDADGLRRILEQDPASSEARDSAGVSLLMHSLYRGRRDLAELTASKKKALDIFEATLLGRLDRLKECIRDASTINFRSKDGFTALHFACFFGQPEAARLLLESGAADDAVAANPMQVMPLHSAASARNLEAARLLLEHGAPVNARQQGGGGFQFTPRPRTEIGSWWNYCLSITPIPNWPTTKVKPQPWWPEKKATTR
jgi:uncharacterized protein